MKIFIFIVTILSMAKVAIFKVKFTWLLLLMMMMMMMLRHIGKERLFFFNLNKLFTDGRCLYKDFSSRRRKEKFYFFVMAWELTHFLSFIIQSDKNCVGRMCTILFLYSFFRSFILKNSPAVALIHVTE